MIFPLEPESAFLMRTADLHQRHQANAEKQTTMKHIYGVKGTTLLSSIVTLPTHATFDLMHLVYLGIGKGLLRRILSDRCVSANELSKIIVSVKVPHFFRRKPRDLMRELVHWKAQEYKNFILYISVPSIFSYFDQVCDSQVCNQIVVLFLLFSTSVYILCEEAITEQMIKAAQTLLLAFQKAYRNMFGSGVQTCSLHALIHLPSQVKRLGPLAAASASCFENVNRFLKNTITGTYQPGNQIAFRFLRYQSCASSAPETTPSQILGKLQPMTDIILSKYSSCYPSLDNTYKVADRFRNQEKIFHSFSYGKKLKCASYYIFLKTFNCFAKIKLIVVKDSNIIVICRKFITVSSCPFHSDSFQCPVTLKKLLLIHSPYITLRKGPMCVFQISDISNYAIVMKLNSLYCGVKVLNNYEHE